MADKKTELSITIKTVDQATAKIKAINDQLDKITKPARDFRKALSDLGEKSGLNTVVDGFKGVGGAIEGLLGKVAIVGGIAGIATHELLGLVMEFDDLGKKAARLGVGVDFLAEMRYAAEKTGVPVEALDEGLQAFNQNLGQARANTGRMAKFLGIVSPALLKQLKGAKDNAAAFDLLAGAMAKISDPAKRAALAQKTLGDSALAPLFAKGAAGIKQLRDRFDELHGSSKGAADGADKVHSAMVDLHASIGGLEAKIVEGLAPALTTIITQLQEWFVAHRADIADWAKTIGDKIPGAVAAVVDWMGKAYDQVKAFVGEIGGLKGVAVAAGAIILGPLVGAVASLVGALVTAISRVGQLKGALGGLGGAAGGGGGFLGALPIVGGAIAGAGLLNELTGGSINEGHGGAMGLAQQLLDQKLAAKHAAELGTGGGIDLRNLRGPDLGIQQPAALAAGVGPLAPQAAKIIVDFANAPRGTRVKTDPKSTADVDFTVGYQLLPQ